MKTFKTRPPVKWTSGLPSREETVCMLQLLKDQNRLTVEPPLTDKEIKTIIDNQTRRNGRKEPSK